MVTVEDNLVLTQTGPGTPMGQVMRRYWMPALLAAELPEPDCAPVRVKLLGETLVAFRDTSGRVGLLEEYCPHRLASLFFGRNEDNGLRCVFHGWKFDVDRRCLDMMNEPPDREYKAKINATAYPAIEVGDDPITEEEWLQMEGGYGWGPEHVLPDFRTVGNRENDWLIDRQVQKKETFTGIEGINAQDAAVQASTNRGPKQGELVPHRHGPRCRPALAAAGRPHRGRRWRPAGAGHQLLPGPRHRASGTQRNSLA